MFKKDKLSRKDAEKLLDAYIEYKKAETKFKELKEELTKDLPEGKILFDGLVSINKSSSTRTIVDGKKILDEHPNINPDRYCKVTKQVLVTINNLR